MVRYRDPSGTSRKKRFARKVDAERFLVSVEHSKMTGSYVDPSAGRVTFRSYAEEWRANQVHRPSTAAQIETNLRRHVYPRIGNRPIGAIRQSEIQSMVKLLSVGDSDSNPLAPATVGIVYVWVATIFGAARADRVIGESPCRQIRLPEVGHTKITPLPAQTVDALIDAVPDR